MPPHVLVASTLMAPLPGNGRMQLSGHLHLSLHHGRLTQPPWHWQLQRWRCDCAYLAGGGGGWGGAYEPFNQNKLKERERQSLKFSPQECWLYSKMHLHWLIQGWVIVLGASWYIPMLLPGRQGFLLLTLWCTSPKERFNQSQEIHTQGLNILRTGGNCHGTPYHQNRPLHPSRQCPMSSTLAVWDRHAGHGGLYCSNAFCFILQLSVVIHSR